MGYEDASQFSREYKRLFGQPPVRDVERLREVARREGSVSDVSWELDLPGTRARSNGRESISPGTVHR